MIRQYNDLYNRPMWPITHIDAVIDNDGRTLRQILGDIPSALSVQEEINKIILNAPEAFDTLKEVADYIKVNGYSNIASALAAKVNTSSMATINGLSLTNGGNIVVSGDGTGDVIAGNVVTTVVIED